MTQSKLHLVEGKGGPEPLRRWRDRLARKGRVPEYETPEGHAKFRRQVSTGPGAMAAMMLDMRDAIEAMDSLVVGLTGDNGGFGRFEVADHTIYDEVMDNPKLSYAEKLDIFHEAVMDVEIRLTCQIDYLKICFGVKP